MDFKQKFEEDFKEIFEKYRGIRKEDLEVVNPWYSCVICQTEGCEYQGSKQKSCPDATPLNIDEFAKRYDFGY